MPDITVCTYVTTDVPDAPLPPIGSVPVPPKPGSKGISRESALVPSYFRGYLIGWYGSTTLQQISDARRSALAGGKTLFRIDIVVDGADYAPSRQHLGQLDRLGVVHLDELPKETERYVLERLEAGESRPSGRYTISELIWRQPAKLDKLWKIPELGRRLTAVIFSAGVGGDARVNYAAVHPRRIKEIRLPASFPSGTKSRVQV